MAFTPVRHARIKTLEPGAVVQLRFGKTSTQRKDDVIAVAKFVSFTKGDEKSLALFEETDADNNVSTITLVKFPNGPWLSDKKIVSLVAVDESTFDLDSTKRVGPVVDHIGDAIKLIEADTDVVYGGDQLVALLKQIKDGVRINREVKSLANKLAAALLAELDESEPVAAADPADEEASAGSASSERGAAFSDVNYAGSHREDGYVGEDGEGFAV